MPKRTLKDIQEFHGISRDQMNAARVKGVNIFNDVEMARALENVRHRLKPDASIPPAAPEAKAQSLEEIEDALRKSLDIDTIKILAAKLKGLKDVIAVRIETGELVPVGEVRQSMTRIVSAARGELLKLSSDLPPKLAGLSEPKMQAIIRAGIIEILTTLSDETGAIYQ